MNVTIQCAARAFLARQHFQKERKYLVPLELFSKARQTIDQKNFFNFPQGGSGASETYFPYTIPVIIKFNPKKAIWEVNHRVNISIQVEKLVEEARLAHLFVPQVRNHGHFIVETRLPCIERTNKALIGAYYEHREKFDAAIADLVEFMCLGKIPEFLGRSNSPYERFLSGSKFPRYDNVIPFLNDKGEGMFGLIDVEGFEKDAPNYYEILITALTLFPYHASTIRQVLEKKGFQCEDKLVNTTVECAKHFIQKCYLDHRQFLQKNGIGVNNFNDIVPVKCIKTFKETIFQKLIVENSGSPFLGDNPQLSLQFFISELNLSSLIKVLKDKTANPLEIQDVVEARSFVAEYDAQEVISIGMYFYLLAKQFPLANAHSLGPRLMEIVFETLQEQGAISYFNPRLTEKKRTFLCIFF
jgi:hypothetical protein